MTLREVVNAVRGYHRQIDLEIRNQWEGSRFIILNLLQSQTKKKLRPRDIAEFPWEKDIYKVDVDATRKRGLELAKKWANNG